MIKTTVSIIGTAGRRDDYAKMSKKLYVKMVREAERLIIEEWGLKWDEIILISGGAAWADHVAVTLKKLHPEAELKLYIPCAWDKDKKEFADDGSRDWRNNPGGTSNYHHKRFSDKLGGNTLQGLHDVLSMDGVETEVMFGFKNRNNGVAKSSYVLAFTWGQGNTPKRGGTLDTWNKACGYEGTRVHCSLSCLV